MRLKFDASIAKDQVECWSISVPLLKSTLFAEDRVERERIIRNKIREAIDVFSHILETLCGRVAEIHVYLASAWTRYYVFRLDVVGEHQRSLALNVLSPDSPLDSFDRVASIIDEVCKLFPDNVAKPLDISDEFMLQEWVNGIPLSEFRDGDILVDVERAEDCILLTSELLYRMNKAGYVYSPWDDYEVMLGEAGIIFLDVTRFVKKRLKAEDFFDFYFGAPFTPPEIIKPSDNPAHRLYWRGVSEKDYFGTSRNRYIELFLEGVARACDSFEEFCRVCSGYSVEPGKIWDAARLKTEKT